MTYDEDSIILLIADTSFHGRVSLEFHKDRTVYTAKGIKLTLPAFSFLDATRKHLNSLELIEDDEFVVLDGASYFIRTPERRITNLMEPGEYKGESWSRIQGTMRQFLETYLPRDVRVPF